MKVSRAQSGFFGPLNKETKSATQALNLPPQITNRLLPNGKMMSDEAILYVKAEVEKLYLTRLAQFMRSKEYQEIPPDQRKAKLRQLKYRRYRKSELEEAIGKKTLKEKLGIEHLPYGVYVAEIEEDGEKKEIFAFINEGIKKFQDAKKDGSDEYEKKIKTNILGIGNNGVAKPLHDIDDPTKCYALKISSQITDTEWKYAKLANLLLARFVRTSPSKKREQEELLMRWIPGENLMDFFQPYENTTKKAAAQGSKINSQELLSLIRKLFTCTNKSAHRLKLIHRDLKPSNFIYCSKTGEMGLSDYGSARMSSADGQFQDDDLAGTAGFIAPESGNDLVYSFQSDVYALGATIAMIIGMTDLKTFSDFPEPTQKYKGFPLLSKHSDEFIKKIPHEKIRGYLMEFVELLRSKNPNQRPSIDQCEEFMKSLEVLNRIIECKADADTQSWDIKMQLAAMRGPTEPHSDLSYICEFSPG